MITRRESETRAIDSSPNTLAMIESKIQPEANTTKQLLR